MRVPRPPRRPGRPLVRSLQVAGLVACAALALSCAPASEPAAPAASEAAPAAVAVEVRSDAEWQPSGVHVAAGETLELTATGEYVFHAAGYATGPDGIPEAEPFSGAWPAPDLTGLALVGRVAPDGEPFLVGAAAKVRAPADGELFFRVNDDIVEENEGVLTVTVRRSAGGAPSSTPETAEPDSTAPASADTAPTAAAGATVELVIPEIGMRMPRPAAWQPGGVTGPSVLASFTAGAGLYPGLNVTLEGEPGLTPEQALDAWLGLLQEPAVHRREPVVLSGRQALLVDVAWSSPLGPLRAVRLLAPDARGVVVVTFAARPDTTPEADFARYTGYLERTVFE